MDDNRCVRLRIIRPVFEDLVVSEEHYKYFDGKSLMNSRAIYLLFAYLSKETREHFISLHLDVKNQIICVDTIAVGSLSSTVVHPREVFKSALLSSCASVAFIHNHPSGDPYPSQDDINITKRLKEAGSLLGIPVLDHVVIGNGAYTSLFEKGLV